MRVSYLLAVFLPVLGLAGASKILLFHPSPSKSHVIYTVPLAKALADRGHHMTVVSPFSFHPNYKNYREIVQPVKGFDDDDKAKMLQGNQTFNPMQILKVAEMNNVSYSMTINNPEFKKIMNEETFDLVIIGFFFMPFSYGIAGHFKCPYILMSPMAAMTLNNEVVGEHSHPATVPNGLMEISGTMTFKQRVLNFLMYTFEVLFTSFIDYQNRGIYYQHFPPEKYPSYDEIKRNCSLVFINKHYSQGVIRPYLPNMVEVGGLQIGLKQKPLPEKLQSWLDGATDGAVLLTFGSNIPINELHEERLDTLLCVLGELKQRVVIKWDLEDTSRLPKNTLGLLWVPQDAVLAHKNIRAFVTHGGSGGVYEAKFHKVPIVGVPFFADQPANVERVVNEGWGLRVSWGTFNTEDFRYALNEILNNEKYKNRVTELSNIYTDRLATPLETAIYWVEYVIRYRGAPHLQYQGEDLNIIQSNSLDVVALLVFILYVFVKIIKISIKFLISKIFGKRKSKKE